MWARETVTLSFVSHQMLHPICKVNDREEMQQDNTTHISGFLFQKHVSENSSRTENMESMSWQNGNLSVVSYERLLKLFKSA